MKKATDILRLFGIKARKEFGQNFLIDENTFNDIISFADISETDLVIEIGPGIGSLTQRLCKHAGHVVGIEIDRSMKAPLDYVLEGNDNVSVLYEDIKKVDIEKDIIGRYVKDKIKNVKVVSNLPYYLATSIITKILTENKSITKMVLMVQKEVAQRICAKPGGKEYGVLSIAVQLYSKAEIAADVPRTSFLPSPNVDSSVVVLNICDPISYEAGEIDFFFRVVKAAFSQRRKTVLNSLFAGFNKQIEKSIIEEILISVGEDPKTRAERISIGSFRRLAGKLSRLTDENKANSALSIMP